MSVATPGYEEASGISSVFDIEKKEQEYWQALNSRDQRYHSAFVYGVTSTGVYCRPTCASRKPNSKQSVVFFRDPVQARQAGFRPCARCKPEEALSTRQLRLVESVCKYATENSIEKMDLQRLGSELGVSPFHLQRTFKKVTGLTPREYIEALRLDKLKMSLRSGNSIRKSTYRAGYKTTGWLYFRPNEKLGMSPSNYKNGGAGVSIYYAISDCPLGKLLVAVTSKGICKVSLADTEQRLISILRSEYPNARLVPQTTGDVGNLSLAMSKIMDYLTKGTDLEISKLPLDIRATAFQARVWKELRKIPYGRVEYYSEVAKRIGLPRATRAVANACAANPVPLVVPCHRVVPKSGGIGEYGLGVERKRALLENEGMNPSVLDRKRK